MLSCVLEVCPGLAHAMEGIGSARFGEPVVGRFLIVGQLVHPDIPANPFDEIEFPDISDSQSESSTNR